MKSSSSTQSLTRQCHPQACQGGKFETILLTTTQWIRSPPLSYQLIILSFGRNSSSIQLSQSHHLTGSRGRRHHHHHHHSATLPTVSPESFPLAVVWKVSNSKREMQWWYQAVTSTTAGRWKCRRHIVQIIMTINVGDCKLLLLTVQPQQIQHNSPGGWWMTIFPKGQVVITIHNQTRILSVLCKGSCHKLRTTHRVQVKLTSHRRCHRLSIFMTHLSITSCNLNTMTR